MSVNNYITSSCLISSGTVYKNGKPILLNREVELPEFLFCIYKHLAINYARFYKMDNLSKLGWLASEILLKESFDASTYSLKM